MGEEDRNLSFKGEIELHDKKVNGNSKTEKFYL